MLESTERHGSSAESWKAIPSSWSRRSSSGVLPSTSAVPAGGRLQPGEDPQDRGLPAARGPEQRQEAALVGEEGGVLQRGDGAPSGAERLGQVLDPDPGAAGAARSRGDGVRLRRRHGWHLGARGGRARSAGARRARASPRAARSAARGRRARRPRSRCRPPRASSGCCSISSSLIVNRPFASTSSVTTRLALHLRLLDLLGQVEVEVLAVDLDGQARAPPRRRPGRPSSRGSRPPGTPSPSPAPRRSSGRW